MLEKYKNFLQKNLILIIALLIATLLIFPGITHVDLIADDAHYTTRAIGLIDLMFANVQPTPLQWYYVFPWWANLSWHDHPPLLFFIQHIFLSVRPNLFLVKLPYALMALGAIILNYAWIKKLYGEKIAGLSSILLALDTHMIAMARTALMESGIMFFISLTIYSFLIFLENKKYWWFFGISLGLMLETKFTTFFVIPVIALYLWFSNRQVLKQKQFYGALGIAFIIFLPVILYNLFMYEDRGHFAIQLTRLLHQNSPWIMSGVAPFTLSNAINTLIAFGFYISFPYLFIATISVIYLLFTDRRYSLLPIMGFFWATIEDILIGTRGLQSLFIAPIVAIALIKLYKRTLQPQSKIIIKISAVAFLLYLFIFTLQSNQSINPLGKEGWSHDNLGRRNYGGKQLNDYLDNLEKTVPDLSRYDQYASLKIRKPSLYKYLNDGPNELNGRTQELKKIIIFDQNILWFSQLWLFARRGFYTDLAIFSTKEMNPNAKTYLSPDTIYLIVATENAALDPTIVRTDTAKFFEDPLIANGVAPTHIYRDDGKIAFNVYKIDRPEIIRTYGFNK